MYQHGEGTVVTSIRIHKDLLKDINKEVDRRQKKLGVTISRNVVIAMLIREGIAAAVAAAKEEEKK